jgi:hypothetical protein
MRPTRTVAPPRGSLQVSEPKHLRTAAPLFEVTGVALSCLLDMLAEALGPDPRQLVVDLLEGIALLVAADQQYPAQALLVTTSYLSRIARDCQVADKWALQLQCLPMLRSALCGWVRKAVQARLPTRADALAAVDLLADLAHGGMPLQLQHQSCAACGWRSSWRSCRPCIRPCGTRMQKRR